MPPLRAKRWARLSERIPVAELKFWSTGRRIFSLGSLVVKFVAERGLYPKIIRAVTGVKFNHKSDYPIKILRFKVGSRGLTRNSRCEN